ncbi:carbohydrate ABC transporter permease [Enterococcus sp.]|uniref:carbohydrate ABC transporter permease n=1 Tax=Enterococcus sp. TaxID=35783 RepID=UPI0028A10EA6|nr:carbohydrate ABC transporter permease [Enterococcus sp.]
MKKVGSYLFLGFFTILFAFPFYFMLVSMTNPTVEIIQGKLTPSTHLLENWRNLRATYDIGRVFMNSARISVLQTLFSITIASLAGYGFEIYQTRAKNVIFHVLLLSMMLPFAATMIPLFRMFGSFSTTIPFVGLDTVASVILPTLSTAFLIFFFRQNTKMFSRSLIEAGRIDGLSEIGIFIRIYMPTMKTTYAAAAIITFINSWNSYLWPLITLQTQEKQTFPLLISAIGAANNPDYGLLMLAIMVATLPTMIVFFSLQKYFVAGMLGSVK